MARKRSKPKMPPDEYRRLLDQVNLQSIFMDACSVKTRREKLASNMRLDVRHKTSYQIEDDSHAKVISDYEIVATKTTRKEFAVKIGCAYRVTLTSESAFSEEFLDIYADVNLQVNTWPYFREFVQSMLQKAGLPPLTLPFLKS